MRVLFFVSCAFVVLAVSWSFQLSGADGRGVRKNELKEFNEVGKLVAATIMKIVNNISDPLVIIKDTLTVPIDIQDKINISGSVNVSNVQLTGISGVEITDAVATLLPVAADLAVEIPEIKLTGEYVIDLLTTSLFPLPIYGAGPFSVTISSTRLDTQMKLRIKLTGKLELTSLDYDLDIYEIGVRIDGLLSDVDPEGKLNEALNTLLNSYLSILFNMWEANLHDSVIGMITVVANDVLANLTLADIIGIIGGGGKLPQTESLIRQ